MQLSVLSSALHNGHTAPQHKCGTQASSTVEKSRRHVVLWTVILPVITYSMIYKN